MTRVPPAIRRTIRHISYALLHMNILLAERFYANNERHILVRDRGIPDDECISRYGLADYVGICAIVKCSGRDLAWLHFTNNSAIRHRCDDVLFVVTDKTRHSPSACSFVHSLVTDGSIAMTVDDAHRILRERVEAAANNRSFGSGTRTCFERLADKYSIRGRLYKIAAAVRASRFPVVIAYLPCAPAPFRLVSFAVGRVAWSAIYVG